MNTILQGAVHLAAMIVAIDVVLLLSSFALFPATTGAAGWLEGAVLLLGYRLFSGQPLLLVGLLRLFRQGIDAFSPALVSALSFTSSILSVAVIGLLLGSPGASLSGRSFSTATELVLLLFTEPPLPGNPMFLVLILSLSPWLVRPCLLRVRLRRPCRPVEECDGERVMDEIDVDRQDAGRS